MKSTMKSTTIKIWHETAKNLRMIYAITGRPMVEILDRLVNEELKRHAKRPQNQTPVE